MNRQPFPIEVADAAVDFEIIRRIALAIKNERNACHCEHYEGAEPDTGWRGVEPCWKRYASTVEDVVRLDESEWCPTCRRRERLHEAYRRATRTRGARMRVLQRITLRMIDQQGLAMEVRKVMDESKNHEGAVENEAPGDIQDPVTTTEPATTETPATTEPSGQRAPTFDTSDPIDPL